METLSTITFDVKTHDGYALSDLSSKLVRPNEMKHIKRRRRTHLITLHTHTPLPASDCSSAGMDIVRNNAPADDGLLNGSLRLNQFFAPGSVHSHA